MRRADAVAGAVLLLLGALALWESSKLPFMTRSVPGSGFLPLCVSLVFTVLSLVLLIGAFTGRTGQHGGGASGAIIPKASGVVAAALALYLLLLSILGFHLATLAVLILLFQFLGRFGAVRSTAMAATATVGFWLLFSVLLSMPLPRSSLLGL